MSYCNSMNTLFQVASWVTLLNGIRAVDEVCERRGLKFDEMIKPERLEEYVTSRKEDVLHTMRQMQAETNCSEAQMARKLCQLPISVLVDVVNEYAAKPQHATHS